MVESVKEQTNRIAHALDNMVPGDTIRINDHMIKYGGFGYYHLDNERTMNNYGIICMVWRD